MRFEQIVGLISLALSSLFLTGCSSAKSGDFNGDRVRVYSSNPAPGETPEHKTLVVKGFANFKPLYSYEYAKIPEWNSIVFVTYKNDEQYKIHLVDLSSGKDIVIETAEPIGSCLGLPDQCWLESVSGDLVIFGEKGWRKETTYFSLDRNAKTLSRKIQYSK